MRKQFLRFFGFTLAGMVGLIFCIAETQAYELLDGKLTVFGYAENWTTVRTHGDKDGRDVGNVRSIFQLEPSYHLIANDNLKVDAVGVFRAWYESAFDVDDQVHDAMIRSRDRTKLRRPNEADMLREAYFDISSCKRTQIKLGKQQIVWGESDGFRMADIINALDFTWNYFFPSWEEIREPLWAARVYHSLPAAEIPLDIELVWIPGDFHRMKFAYGGANWAPRGLPNGFLVNMEHSEPSFELRNSEFGARLKYWIADVDVSLFGFYGRNRFPIMTDNMDDFNCFMGKYGPNFVDGEGCDLFEYSWMTTVGGTFNYYESVLKTVFRGECAFNMDKDFNRSATKNPPYNNVERDQFSFMLGADRNTMLLWLNPQSTWFLSMQLFYSKILDHSSELVTDFGNDSSQTMITFLANSSYLRDQIQPQVFTAYDFSGNAWVAPQLKFILGSHWRFIVGGNFMWGNSTEPRQNFDLWRDNDEVFFRIQYQFT